MAKIAVPEKNIFFLQLIREKHRTPHNFCKKEGICQTEIYNLLNCRFSILRKNGGYRNVCQRLAEMFEISPFKLFPPFLYERAKFFSQRRFPSKEIGGVDLSKLPGSVDDQPEVIIEREQLKERFLEWILKEFDKLKGIEAQVLLLRYGLDGSEPLTLKEIGGLAGKSRERIRQIERKALGKIKSIIPKETFF